MNIFLDRTEGQSHLSAAAKLCRRELVAELEASGGINTDSSLIRCRLLAGGELRFFFSNFWD